jgi:hypothetical protein
LHRRNFSGTGREAVIPNCPLIQIVRAHPQPSTPPTFIPFIVSLRMATTVLLGFLSGIIVSTAVLVWLHCSGMQVTSSREGGKNCNCSTHSIADVKTTDNKINNSSTDVIKNDSQDKKDLAEGVYKCIQQRQNKLSEWEVYNSSIIQSGDEKLDFLVYHRHYRPGTVPEKATWLEIQNPVLKKVLQDCLRYVDSVLDDKPFVRSGTFHSNNRSIYINCSTSWKI